MPEGEGRRLAEAVRRACVDAAVRAWEDGGVSGLCIEGRWDLAVDAMRHVDLGPLLHAPGDDPPVAGGPDAGASTA